MPIPPPVVPQSGADFVNSLLNKNQPTQTDIPTAQSESTNVTPTQPSGADFVNSLIQSPPNPYKQVLDNLINAPDQAAASILVNQQELGPNATMLPLTPLAKIVSFFNPNEEQMEANIKAYNK